MVTVPAVALKLTVVAPTPMATEAGTASAELFDDTDIVAPPVGAACVSVTVHVLLAFEEMLEGVHWRVETVADPEVTVIKPPVPDTATFVLSPSVPITPLIGIVSRVLLLVGERLAVTTATTPLAIVFAFMPLARHITAPALALQFSVLPAAASAGPDETLKEMMSFTG